MYNFILMHLFVIYHKFVIIKINTSDIFLNYKYHKYFKQNLIKNYFNLLNINLVFLLFLI